MADRKQADRDPFWITAVAAAVMLVGARVIRAYTPFGYNIWAEPFNLLLLLADILLHFAIFFVVLIPLRALWVKTSARRAGA